MSPAQASLRDRKDNQINKACVLYALQPPLTHQPEQMEGAQAQAGDLHSQGSAYSQPPPSA